MSRMIVSTTAHADRWSCADGAAGLIRTITKLPSDSTGRIDAGTALGKRGSAPR
jgi:hypothetical protein